MRKLAYLIIIALALCIPVQRLDVAKLQPVEAVAAYMENKKLVLVTDTEEKGRGETVQQALADLKEKASSAIYLDTARYLLVGPGGESCVQELLNCLRRNVKVRPYLGGDLAEAVKYLDAHDRPAVPDN